MKKWRTGIVIAVAAVALVGGATAYAAGPGGDQQLDTGTFSGVLAAVCPWSGYCWWDGWDGCWAGENGFYNLCGGPRCGYLDAGDGVRDGYSVRYTGGGYRGGRHCGW